MNTARLRCWPPWNPHRPRVVHRLPKSAKPRAAVDGQAGAEFDRTGKGNLTFSPENALAVVHSRTSTLLGCEGVGMTCVCCE